MRFLWGFWRTWNYLFLRRKKSEPVIRISTAIESPSPSVNTHYNVTGEMMIEVRWQNARQNALGGHERYHLRSACLAYLLGSFIRKTLSSVSFPPSSTPSSWGRRRSEMRWKVSTCWRRVMGENGGICRGTLWWGNNSTEQVTCCSVLRLIDITEYDGAGNKTFGYKKKTRYHI